MDAEAARIFDLLQELGREDAACRRLALYAQQGEPILKVCEDAIRALDEQRDALKRLVAEMADKPSR